MSGTPDPFTPAEIAAFHQDTRGMWDPSAHDQLRLLATVDKLAGELARSNETIVSLAKRLGAVTARLTVIGDQVAAGIEASGIDCTGLAAAAGGPRG